MGGDIRTSAASVWAMMGATHTPMSPQSQQESCSRWYTKRRTRALGEDGSVVPAVE